MTEPYGDIVAAENGVPFTAPISELQTTGLPEHPSVSEEALRSDATTVASQWERVRITKKLPYLSSRI